MQRPVFAYHATLTVKLAVSLGSVSFMFSVKMVTLKPLANVLNAARSVQHVQNAQISVHDVILRKS